jgi:multimeric flavodoxin WrbA
MKVIGISGSPRAGGNTELLLHHALRPFQEHGWEAEPFHLSAMKIQPCMACDTCAVTGQCVIADDMQLIYEGFSRCDAIIIATPVYYRNISAQLKAVFDRSYALKKIQPLAGKPGGAIAVGRGSGGGQALALSIIYNYLLSSGALGVPGELNGVSAIADKPGEIALQQDRLRQARVLGENVMQIAERLHP